MLSVIIITKNEAEHIGPCLESVQWADEIIIVDSGSTDGTQNICNQYTDKIIQTDWPGFGPQKNRALDAASGKWVLSLDADERITPELHAEIQSALENTGETAGFEIPRLSYYCGKAIRHGGWWPDYVLRLFRRDRGCFSNALVHEKLEVRGAIQRFRNPLLHFSFDDFEEVLHKIDNHSSLAAQMLFEKGRSSSFSKALLRGFWSFLRTYILRAGFLDGRYGVMLALSNAEGTYYKYLKLLYLQQNASKK